MTNDPPTDRFPNPGDDATAFAPPTLDERVDEPPRRRTGVIAGLALAAAFLVGLAIGWQVLGGDDEAGDGGDEADTAELACSAFAKLDVADVFAEGSSPLDDGTLFLLQGAVGLGQAAGAESDAYGELAEQSEIIERSLQLFDREGAIEAGDAVAATCEDLFPE